MVFIVTIGVVVVGNLAQNAVTLAAALKRSGHASALWITQSEWGAGVLEGLLREIGRSAHLTRTTRSR